MEGRELLTAQEIEERDQENRDRIRSRFESLETAVDETQKRIAAQEPRRLSLEQIEAIKEAVAPFRGTSMNCMCSLGDAESCSYATEFLTVFADAGWETGGIQGSFISPSIGNVCVGINNDVPTEDIADRPEIIAVFEVFHRLGLSSSKTAFLRSRGVPKDGLAICIAKKPLPREPQDHPDAIDEPSAP